MLWSLSSLLPLLTAFKSLKLFTLQDSVGHFCSLVLQAMKPFPELLTRVTNAVGKRAPSGSMKQLTWEGLSTITSNIIAPVRNDNFYKWVLAAHDIHTQNRPIFTLTASIKCLGQC